MAQRTSEVREEIEATRARVGEEVDALSYKTDVGARLDDYVDDKKQAVVSKVTGAKDALSDAVTTVVPNKSQVKRGMGSARSAARSNPLGLAVAGAAVGAVVGFLLPSTRVEDEHLGDASERVKETAADAGQQALERGKDVAQSALETVRDEGTQQTRELASDLKDAVHGDTPSGGERSANQSVATS